MRDLFDHRRRAVQELPPLEEMVRGSVFVRLLRCGKPGCHCARGEKHVSLYLAIRVGARRKMIYVPPDLEPRVRDWVQSSQEIDRLLEIVSQSCLEQLLRDKQAPRARRGKTRPRKDQR